MKIYVAGKIHMHDWRHRLLGTDPREPSSDPNQPWTDRKIAFDHAGGNYYVGPYFTACDHGCSHRPTLHGALDTQCYAVDPGIDDRRALIERCKKAIGRADLVFAWLDAPDAHGTIWELGYAHALGKRVVIAVPPGYDATDQWFACLAADRLIESGDPVAALHGVLRFREPVMYFERINERAK